ncbi:hypothetical protein ACFP1Z_13365 [Streptomyces gamaensis]|uniref:Uncharacterized protein n=1 Tax=Streptomyces gamaensis TaxID=1763542 RepID=A0ABW0Z119_9ACTN
MRESDSLWSDAGEPDPDLVAWVRGVDYVTGWRAAKDAAAELEQALTAAGVDAVGASMSAAARADGAGVVRLVWPVETVRTLAGLLEGAGEPKRAG